MKSFHHSYRVRALGKTGLAAALVAVLGTPLVSHASSFQLPTDNAAGWGRAWAGGSLFPNDPTAAYNNPAAMAFINAPMIQATGTGIRASAKFNGSFTDASGQPVSGGNPNGFGKFIPFPDIAWVAPINDRLVIGGSLTVPYGLISDYSPSWQGRYFGDKTDLESIAVSLSAGFKVNDEFSIGAGIVGQRTKAQLNSTLDPSGSGYALLGPGVEGLTGKPQSTDLQLNINVKEKTAFGYFVGFEFKPTDKDSLGVSYHSRIKQTLRGVYDVYGSAQGKGILGLAPLINPNLPAVDTAGTANASAGLNMPAFLNIDWVHAFTDRFTAAATVEWTDWSSFQNLTLKSNGIQLVNIPQNNKDSWTYTIGGDYKLDDHWTLRAGLGYDKTPTITATRDPRLPDGSRRLASAGIGYNANNHWGIDLGYQHEFVGKVRVNQGTPQPGQSDYFDRIALGAANMNGTFDDHGDVVSLTGTYKF